MLGDFFGNDMIFYTFDDFMDIRKFLKRRLKFKNLEYKMLYRLYVESRPWIKDYYRGCIWDYLNGYMTDAEIIDVYIEYRNATRKVRESYE